MEKFNYLRCFLEGDALQAIAGFSLTNDNCKEALQLLQNRYGNTQQIIAAHMNALVKMSSVYNDNLSGLRKISDDIISHGRSLVNLGVESQTYGSLLCPVILEKLPNELRLIINKNNNENDWNFTKILDLINVELKVCKACFEPPGSSAFNRENRKFKKGDSKCHSFKGSGRECVFCDGDHWSGKCRIVSDVQARKDLLKKGNRCFMCLRTGHISPNCQKTKSCFYCKKLHKSTLCSEKTGSENRKVSTNYASNILPALLQTADLVIENPLSKNQV